MAVITYFEHAWSFHFLSLFFKKWWRFGNNNWTYSISHFFSLFYTLIYVETWPLCYHITQSIIEHHKSLPYLSNNSRKYISLPVDVCLQTDVWVGNRADQIRPRVLQRLISTLFVQACPSKYWQLMVFPYDSLSGSLQPKIILSISLKFSFPLSLNDFFFQFQNASSHIH